RGLMADEENRENPDAAETEQPQHAVPSEEAAEIAGSAEDAALEAAEEAQDRVAEQQAVEEDEEEPAPREKPAVPGAHLEVDIVPEGADPLGRGEQSYEDPYALDEDGEPAEQAGADAQDETLAQPIATAAIDLASGARYRATG